jgi:hypothetical protein
VTSQQFTITGDTLAALYTLSPDVTMFGPGLPSAGLEPVTGSVSDDATTIKATYDFSSLGAPLGPGAYTLAIGLKGLTSTKLDTVGVAVTGPTPDIAGNSLAIETTGDEPSATITSGTSTFATGDTVSITGSGGTAVSGLSFTTKTITAGTITGDFAAASAAVGTYDLNVTDTAGQKGTCTGCVTVSAGPTMPTNLVAVPTDSTDAVLAWGPPADESTTLQKYTVVVSATSGATSTDSGISVLQPTGTTANPVPTGATVSGLVAGTTYFVSVTATDTDGTSPAATASFASPYSTTITYNTTKSQVTYGGKVTTGGQLVRFLSSGGAEPVSDATVYILAKSTAHAKIQLFRQLTTNSKGDFTTSFTPTANAIYAAYYGGKVGSAGTPGDIPAISIFQTIDVAPKVTISSHSAKSYHLGAFSVKGKVSPSSKGQKVYLVQVSELGVHKTLAYVTVGKGSKFSFHEAVLRKKGTYKVQVQIKKHGRHAAGKSKTFTLKRT